MLSTTKIVNFVWLGLCVILVTSVAGKTSYLSMSCNSKPLVDNSRNRSILKWLIQTSGELSITSKQTPQHAAACWILTEDPQKRPPGKKLSQRYTLAVLYHATMGSTKWQVSTNWMSGKSECSWYGVSCDMRSTVVGLDLGFNDLFGVLPSELGVLKHIIEADFHGNDLQGVLPYAILVSWKACRILRLHMNGFFGSLNTEIGLMKNLRELHLFGNYFSGKIPTELANLSKLEVLDIYANAFEGTIPSHLGKLKALAELDVHDNNLVGNMPNEVCERKLPTLISDCLGSNPEVRCSCCNICCAGLPFMKCMDVKTKEEVIVGADPNKSKENEKDLAGFSAGGTTK